MAAKRTIQKEISLSGVGIHSGKTVRLVLKPAESGNITFLRVDLGRLETRLNPRDLEARNNTTLLGEKFRVRTVEHLMAALFAFGINSLTVELDADEIPIMDGSALPFAQAIDKAGTRRLPLPVRPLKIRKSLVLEENGASVSAFPSSSGLGIELSYSIEYSHPAIGRQSLSLRLSPQGFVREIAPARTFGFLSDAEMLRARGLALGGSFENAVILDGEKILNGPLRFPDEFVRHKLLDLVGDLSLLSRPLIGRFEAHKAGHRLHVKLVQFLLDHPEFWIAT
jgi:UDP-3-O-[3-hydroxymyristoyl] N-acetylglucosamine deacetylase